MIDIADKKEYQKEIVSHYLVTLAFLLVMLFFKGINLGLLFLSLGSILGTFFLDVDHLVYWFYFHPEKQDSKIALMLWHKKDIEGMLALLGRYHDTHTRLVFHTFFFQMVLLVFSFFIFTSGGSLFASGLVAAMNLHLLKDEWEEFLEKNYDHLNDWLFWQVKRKVNFEEQKLYLVLVSLIFGIFILLV